MICRALLILPFFLAATGPLLADTARIDALYVDGFFFSSPIVGLDGEALDAGTAADGDGDLLQIGYFDGVSTGLDPSSYGALEWSRFTPITGLGSANSHHVTSIGDAASDETGPFGFFTLAVVIDDSTDSDLPTDYAVRLGIRIFDGKTEGGARAFNTVTSDDALWLLNEPQAIPSPIGSSALNLGEADLVWQSGDAGAFRTAIALVPEPGVLLTALTGFAIFLCRRRRNLSS